MTGVIEVIIIDASEIRREGLRLLLSQSGYAPIWCGSEAPDQGLRFATLSTTPLVMIATFEDDGRDQVRAVKQLFPDSRVVLMGGETLTPEQFQNALASGVDTVTPANISTESLIFTLRLVHGGAVVFPKHMVPSLGRLPLSDDLGIARPEVLLAEPNGPYGPSISSSALFDGYRLSEREESVLMWLRDGLPNKEIARKMAITEATVKVHVKAILRKVKMRNRTQVASWATKYNFAAHAAIAAE